MSYGMREDRETDGIRSLLPLKDSNTAVAVSSDEIDKGHAKKIRIDVNVFASFANLAKHHIKLLRDKRAARVHLFYGSLAICLLLLLIMQTQVVRHTTNASFFYNAHELQEAHRASCRTRTWAQDDAGMSLLPPSRLCASVSQGSLTASSLWKSHLDVILKASKHPKDKIGKHQAWQKALLELLAPGLLERGLQQLPSSADVQRVVNIIDMRREAMFRKFILKEKGANLSRAPMLHVAVFGGSVPEGAGCNELSEEILLYLPARFRQQYDSSIEGKDCSWPQRLQLLADAFLGKWVVVVHNLAVGGTNSRVTIPTFEYQLYQQQPLIEQGGPDIIINAYSVNDNLREGDTPENTTMNNLHYDNNLNTAQDFVNKALQSRPCYKDANGESYRPVIVFLNDAFGNHNSEMILGDDIRADAVRLLSELYRFLYVSSVAPVKAFVQANERETTFSPHWYRGKSNIRVTNGLYDMAGHQYTAYTLAYTALSTLVKYCVDEEFETSRSTTSSDPTSGPVSRYPYPPEVDYHSEFASFDKHWASYAKEVARKEEEYCLNVDPKAPPCSFAFTSNPAGTVRNIHELNQYVLKYTKNPRADNTGWSAVNNLKYGWQNKLGYVATKPGASVLLTISDIANPVQRIIVQYIKTDSTQSSGSRAEFDMRIYESSTTAEDPLFRKTVTFSGDWEGDASTSFQDIVEFHENAAAVGQTVTLRITLTGGDEFKILGLMLCSR